MKKTVLCYLFISAFTSSLFSAATREGEPLVITESTDVPHGFEDSEGSDGRPQKPMIANLAFTPDEHLVASHKRCNDLHVINLNGYDNIAISIGEEVAEVGHTIVANPQPDKRHLALVTRSNKLLVYKKESEMWDSGSEVLTHDSFLAEPTYSNDGSKLAIWKRDGEIIVLNTDDYTQLARLDIQKETSSMQKYMPEVKPPIAPPWVSAIAFSPDANLIASGTTTGFVLIWDIENSDEPIAMFRANNNQISALSFSPDGRLLTTLSLYFNRKTIPFSSKISMKCWNASEWNCVRQSSPVKPFVLGISDCRFSPDGLLLAIACSLLGESEDGYDEEIHIFNARTLDRAAILKGHTRFIAPLAFGQHNGTPVLASGTSNGELKLWDLTPVYEALPSTSDSE